MEDGRVVDKPNRHKHKLRYTELPPYKCSGCKGWGANTGYKCASCPEFVLHKFCFDSNDEIFRAVLPRGLFKFRTTTRLRHDCVVCGVLIRGFLFESSSGSKVHPLCLEPRLQFGYSGHPDHDLHLDTNEAKVKYRCSLCREEHKEWKYRCPMVTCNVELDMNCAMIYMHNLSQHGISQVYKPSKAGHVLKKVAKVGKAIGIAMAGAVVNAAVGEAGDALADRGRLDYDGGEDEGRLDRDGEEDEGRDRNGR